VRLRTGLIATALGLLLSTLAAASVVAAPFLNGEFEVSALDPNNKIVQGPDGNVWVTLDDAVDDVARITPQGAVAEFDLEVDNASGIAADADKDLWITHEGGVTEFDPGDPEGTEMSTAIPQIETFHSIVFGPDGNLWVAAPNALVRVPPGDPGAFQPFAVVGLSPRDIEVAGGLLAIADFGESRILTATLADPPVITEYAIAGGSQGVAGGPGGQIAFTQQGKAPFEYGLLTPPGPPVTTASPGSDPFGVTFGADSAYWIAQFASNGLTRLTPQGQSSSLGGFAAKGGPRQITAGPANTLWVTLEDPVDGFDRVARVAGVTDSPVFIPISRRVRLLRTRIVKGPRRKVKIGGKRALVRFRFRSPDKGAKLECALRRGPKGGRFPKPRFRDCKSPKIYALRPGKYRFWARAVIGDEFDRSPAKRTFFVIRKR
jgi:streptogramin lyase